METSVSPTCPKCSRNLQVLSSWTTSTLNYEGMEQETKDHVQGVCEIHGNLHITATRFGGWQEEKK